jgi:hypothetical protein
MKVSFDEFVKKTMSVGLEGEDADEAAADARVPDDVRAAANTLSVDWDWNADPFDFPYDKRGLYIVDGKVTVVGDVGSRGGRAMTAWVGKLVV